LLRNVDWGRYRLDVIGDDGAETSVLFDAGWYVEAKSIETPDGLEIALDKDRYAVGETAQLRISPRFAGEVLITVGTERLITTLTATVGMRVAPPFRSRDHRGLGSRRLCDGDALPAFGC
jgi:uncharacterized protein YfaS (alpha-2-macroglobulin family)